MAAVRQPISIPFSQGMNQKPDPWQIPVGQFSYLRNSVFTKDGLLKKRNGFGSLPSLPNTTSSYLTTLNDNLTAVGSSISAFNESNNTWVSKGNIQPLTVQTLPLIRNSINQTQADSAIAPNGLVCTVYTETNAGTSQYKYAIADSVTGQNIISPTLIPAGAGAVTGSPRVFILGPHFIVAFTNVISAVSHLQYIAISYANPTVVTAAADLAASYISSARLSWDGIVLGNNLYIAYNTTSGGQAVKVVYLNTALSLSAAISFVGSIATVMTLATDTTGAQPVIYVSFYDSAGSTGYSAVIDSFLNVITAPVQIISSGTVLNLASTAQNGSVVVYSEVQNAYGYDSGVPTNYINATPMTQAGSVGSVVVTARGIGLASKAFLINGTSYFLAAYQSSYQPSYFLINATLSTSAHPIVSGKLAYSNGGGYLSLGLPSVSVSGTTASIAYLCKDLISAVNKGTALPSGTQTAGIYAQTGVNMCSFDISNSVSIDTAEIGSDLHISGGFLWMYDGYLPVEHNFFVWPDNVEATWSATGGSIHAQPDGATNTNAYWYQVTYEWSDNQGNIFRSAPSIPVPVTTTSNGTSGSITLHIPTLRLTYKTANPVKIVIYRWSVAQEVYYQATPLTSAVLNDPTADSVTFVDTLADASILGNDILYTTGGVVEDVNAPATSIMTLFDTRLWLVDAEDPNLLWFSKQVIESTPVEMSDLLTFYVAPNTGTTGSTGPITALAPMDDKLIIFKKDAIYYINGTGPDNTGANSQYSQAVFITSTVGCSNQASIVLTPSGLMFQSDKGIWILGRNLETSYIGAAVEDFNLYMVTSANAIPETNQVRFSLSGTDTFLMYDYYYNRWGEFVGLSAESSCIYKGMHTFIDSSGLAYQETANTYVDGSTPVLLSFQTGWINVAGLQGYLRSSALYLLGKYLSPYKLSILIAYDYNDSFEQSSLITPGNFSSSTPSPYGVPTPFGSKGDVAPWRVFFAKQRCQAVKVTVNENYDPSFGVLPGAGLTLSGLLFLVSVRRGWRSSSAANTVGATANG